MLCGSDLIAAEVEEVIDLIVGREEALRLTGRFSLYSNLGPSTGSPFGRYKHPTISPPIVASI
jgi:hypothetical protein